MTPPHPARRRPASATDCRYRQSQLAPRPSTTTGAGPQSDVHVRPGLRHWPACVRIEEYAVSHGAVQLHGYFLLFCLCSAEAILWILDEG